MTYVPLAGNHAHAGRRAKPALACLLGFAFLLRIGFVIAAGLLGKQPAEYREYLTIGHRLLEYGTFASPIVSGEREAEPSYLMPPGYSLLVAGAFALFGAENFASIAALQLLNAIAATVTVWLVFRAAEALAGRRAAWIAAMVATLNLLLFGFTALIWDTYLFTLGAAAAVWFAIALGAQKRHSSSGGQPPSVWLFLGFGSYLGFLALLNPAFTPAYPLLVLWPCCRTGVGPCRAIAMVTLAVVGWAAAITPWTIRNYRQFGESVYVRGGLGTELWLGSCPEAEIFPSRIYAAHYPLNSQESQLRINRIGEQAFIADYYQKAKEAIGSDPLRFLRLTTQRVSDFWLGTVRTHAKPPEMQWWPRDPQRLAAAIFLSLEILLVVGGLVLPQNRPARMWLLAMVVAFSLIYTVTHVELRYRAPIEPMIAAIIGLTLARRSGHDHPAASTNLRAACLRQRA